MNEIIELGGRRFRRVGDSTVSHDFYTMNLVNRAGLDRLDMIPGQTPEDAVEAMISKCLESGLTMDLLGCLLLPEDVKPIDWTPEVSEGVALHLSRLTEDADKKQIMPLVASMLICFFRNGLASLRTSKQSSAHVDEPRESKSQDAGE